MNFSVGYQMMSTDTFVNELIQSKDKIHEVYFSWGGYANGRNSQLLQKEITSWEAQRHQESDIEKISEAGISLNLLFNAMCYGKDSQSKSFFSGIGNTVEYLQSRYLLRSVTTTSPLIAKFLKANFPELEIRASVNMSIGTVAGMDYVKDYFDSFYLQRELNRDFSIIDELKKWCESHGKKLYALANSGCLNHCSAHVFHDNLVAHETEIAQMNNGYSFDGICRQYLVNPENHRALVENSSFIRPEDIHLYEGIFPAMKLATRVNFDPVRVLRAYIRGSYRGSTLELLEPNHTAMLYPYLLDNSSLHGEIVNNRLVYTNFENAMVKLEEKIC